uniref:Envelope protein n=1 Tax=Aquila chrysaetos chrysaetos TaxID=223781 RepID=A0A663FGB7_AQUCH
MESHHKTRWTFSFYAVIWGVVGTLCKVWDENLFVRYNQELAKDINVSSCWMCTLIPKQGETFPFIGVPLRTDSTKTLLNRTANYTCLYGNGSRTIVKHKLDLDSRDPHNNNRYNWSWRLKDMERGRGGDPIMMRPHYANTSSFLGTLNGTWSCYLPWEPSNCNLPDGRWYLSANGEAHKSLPINWWGECTEGIIIPQTLPILGKLQGIFRSPWHHTRTKRTSNPLIERGTTFHSVVRWLFPMLGVSELEKTNTTADALGKLQAEIDSLAKIMIQNRLALDMLTAKEGGVCVLINQSCCAYLNERQQVETDIEKIWEISKELHLITMDDTSWGFSEIREKLTSWLPNLTWPKQLFVTAIIIIFLLIILCTTIRCSLWCFQSTGDSYSEWKKNQLRRRLESNKYFERMTS